MERKKKYFGGLKLLLPILFTLFLSMFSTCYADVSKDFIDWTLLEYSTGDYSFISDYSKNKLSSFYNDEQLKNNLYTYINDSLDYFGVSDLNNYNCVVVYSGSDSDFTIAYTFSNCTFPNNVENLGYINFTFNYSLASTWTTCGVVDGNIYTIYIDNNGYITRNKSTPSIAMRNPNPTTNSSATVLNLSGVLNYVNTQSVCTYNLVGSKKFLLLDSGRSTYLNNVTPEPDPEPSGDDGGGGTVTPSGDDGSSSTTPDYTNQLNDINNNISNSTTAITNQISGDTQKITNSIDNLNNTLTEQPNLNNTNITSGDIERCFRF